MDDSCDQRVIWFYAIILILLTAIVYWQVTDSDFIRAFDDGKYVTSNPAVQAGLTIRGISWAFTATRASNWHPITWISHMLDYQIYGPAAAGHHLTSLFFHLVNVLLLFMVLYRATSRPRRSLAVAALFALHPLHVESVAWVAERKDVLSTFFMLLTILVYLSYVRRPSIGRYALMITAFAFGLMSKPMLVTLPLLLLQLDYWPLGRFTAKPALWPRLILEKAPLAVLSAASCAVTIWAQHRGGAMASLAQYSLGVRTANAGVACIGYLGKMLCPYGLAAFYPHPGAHLPVWEVISSMLLIAAITAFAVRSTRGKPYITIGWLWYIFTLLPVIGLVQVGRQAMADRYTYVPLIGIFIAIVWILADLVLRGANERRESRRRILSWVSIAMAAVLAMLTYVQVGYWQNSETLFRRAIAVTRNNDLAHYNLGVILSSEGKLAEAETEFNEVLRIGPDNPDTRLGLAQTLMKQGKYDKAYPNLVRAIKMKPDMAEAYLEMGIIFSAHRDIHRAISCYEQAVKFDPNNEPARYNLGNTYGAAGRFDEAITQYREAIRLQPEHAAAHHNLGLAYQFKHEMDLAVNEYTEAARITPDNPQMLYDLATALYETRDYAGAWKAIHKIQQLGAKPGPAFIKQLSAKMPDPQQD